MFGLPWFKKETQEEIAEAQEESTVETVQVRTDGYTHAYDVPAFIPDGKGGYTKGIAQVFVAEEEEEDGPTLLGRLVADYYRDKKGQHP